jgi:hypothetical protein
MEHHDPCFKGWKEEDGNTAGRCCCNCKYQKPVVSHPWNRVEPMKGSITKSFGWGCLAPEMNAVVFYDFQHSMCEMHDFKNNVYQLKRVK